jgi:cytochrome c-type biogenesis protein CcmH
MLGRRSVLGAAAVVAAAAVLWLVSASHTGAAVRPTLAQVSEGLTCQCGCGLTVANCNHPTCEFSVPVRAEIQKMIDKGKTGPEIIAFYRNKYGEKVLSAPTAQGFNLLAWIMPFLAIAVGGTLIGFAARRWRSAAPEAPVPDAGAADAHASRFNADLKRRLDDELKERI